jgi:hypothetical protein
MVAVAWALMVAYSIPLFSVLESLIKLSGIATLDENLQDLIVFLYGLGVVGFLGGSQIPAVFLKKRNFVIQFAFSATFGLILLLIAMLNDTILRPLNVLFLMPIFSTHPVIALEYLTLPYLFMISIDLHLSGRFTRFSSPDLARHLVGTIVHPRRTFEQILCHQSILFSLVSAVITSVVWLGRIIVVSQWGFVPARWQIIPLSISLTQEMASKAALTIPALLLLWLSSSALTHIVARRLDGKGSIRDVAALLGFALVPSWITVAVDLAEIGLQMNSLLAVQAAFVLAGFVVPLIVWPFILATFVAKVSHGLPWRAAGLTSAISFLPVLILCALAFL